MKLRLLGPYTLMGSMAIVFITTIIWVLRAPIHTFAFAHPAFFPAIVFGAAVLLAGLASVLAAEGSYLRHVWLERTARVTDLASLESQTYWARVRTRFPDPLEKITQPILRTRLGAELAAAWFDAGFGKKASRYVLLLFFTAIFGGVFGSRIGGAVLVIALTVLMPLIPRTVVNSRAENNRRRFSEQLPQVIEILAAGLAAGLSFQQAVSFTQEEVQPPAGTVFARIGRRIALGFPLENALWSVQKEQSDEGLALVTDGVILQHQFGGDIVRMLEDLGEVLRERVELEREVRAITAQGRLSGIVISALVPVSAAFLLSFNPQYIDVMFNTVIGQVLIVTAMVLLILGWTIISRLLRVPY